MYAKIFAQILDSSIVENPELRFTFMDLLILADPDGVVDITHEAIARRTNRPIEVIRKTILQLEGPDQRSRSTGYDGARIKRLDDHRDWGWVILNYRRFREMASEEDRRRHGRERTQAYRERDPSIIGTAQGYVYYAQVPGTDEIKIGFSRNPWSRMKEFQTAKPGMVVVATEATVAATELLRHKEFATEHLNGEWFKLSDNLRKHLDLLRLGSTTKKSGRSSYVVATPPSPSSSSYGEKSEEKGGDSLAHIPTEAEFVSAFMTSGIPEDYLRTKWSYFQGNHAWLDRYGKLKDYRVLVNGWWIADRCSWNGNPPVNAI